MRVLDKEQYYLQVINNNPKSVIDVLDNNMLSSTFLLQTVGSLERYSEVLNMLDNSKSYKTLAKMIQVYHGDGNSCEGGVNNPQ